jgi:UDP:flavonoid glycosyltransferase YjiC (YdhE family)
MLKKFKILCFPLPASGHSNPFYPILNELLKYNEDLHIVVYTTKQYVKNFENLGVECRLVDVEDSALSLDGVRSELAGLKITQELTKYACDNLETLAREIEKEDPDLIIYDGTTIYVRWCVLFYQKCYNASIQNKPYKKSNFRPKKDLPPLICYSPMFVMDFKSYPNFYEMSMLFQFSKSISFRVMWYILKYVGQHYRLCLKYGFKLTNPFKKTTPEKTPYTKFTIATILEELQPRSHMLDKEYFKFVGASIDDDVNHNNYSAFQDPYINELLEYYDEKENKTNILNENEHLVYVSLGTVFNDQFETFKTIPR